MTALLVGGLLLRVLLLGGLLPVDPAPCGSLTAFP